MHVIHYILRVSLLVTTPATRDVPHAKQSINLPSALEIVNSKHPDLLKPRAAVLAAEAAVDQAKAGRFPLGEAQVIVGIVNGAQQVGVPDDLPEELAPLFTEGGANDPFYRLGPFTRASLQLTQPLFTFGKISQGIKAAKAGLAARNADLARKQQDLRLKVRQIYYGYQLASELHNSFGKLEDTFEKAHQQAEERFNSGESTVSQTDILKLRVALLSLSKRVLEFQRQKQTALLAFRRSLGYALDSPVFPASDRLRPADPIDIPNEPPLLDKKIFKQPTWKATQAGLAARTAATKVAARAMYPDFFIGIRADLAWAPTRDDILNPYLRDEFNRLRGGPFLGFRWPLDMAVRFAQKRRAEAQLAIQTARAEQARTGLPLEAKNALLLYEEKKASLKLSQKARKAGRSLSFITATNFGLGIGEAKEIIESLGLYARSLGEYYKAVFEHNMAIAKLSEILGVTSAAKVPHSQPPRPTAQTRASNGSEET